MLPHKDDISHYRIEDNCEEKLRKRYSYHAWVDEGKVKATQVRHAHVPPNIKKVYDKTSKFLGDYDGYVKYRILPANKARLLLNVFSSKILNGSVNVIDPITTVVTPSAILIKKKGSDYWVSFSLPETDDFIFTPDIWSNWRTKRERIGTANKYQDSQDDELVPAKEDATQSAQAKRNEYSDKILALKEKMSTAATIVENWEKEENELLFAEIEKLSESIEPDNKPRLQTVMQSFDDRLTRQIERKGELEKFERELNFKMLEKSLGIRDGSVN